MRYGMWLDVSTISSIHRDVHPADASVVRVLTAPRAVVVEAVVASPSFYTHTEGQITADPGIETTYKLQGARVGTAFLC